MSIGALGLTMEEIQQVIAEASEHTPDVGPDGADLGDPEYVTAYMLNIVIPLLQYNNLRIEEQLAAIGIRVPTRAQIEEAVAQQMAQNEQATAAEAANGMDADAPGDETYSDMVRTTEATGDGDPKRGTPTA